MSHFFTFLRFEVWCYTCILFYSCKHFTYFCLQTKYDHRKIIYMNFKTTKMSEYKFYFDEDTVNYYVEFEELNGWASTAMRVYEYIADECDWDSESDMRALYLDLLTQVEDKINE